MKTKPVKLAWDRRLVFNVVIDRGDEKCSLTIAPSPDPTVQAWMALAVTTPESSKTLDDALDDHGHKIIGTYKTLAKTMLAVESWAAHWLKGHKVANAEKCLCKGIA